MTHWLGSLQGTLRLVDGVEVHLPHPPGALGKQDFVGSTAAN